MTVARHPSTGAPGQTGHRASWFCALLLAPLALVVACGDEAAASDGTMSDATAVEEESSDAAREAGFDPPTVTFPWRPVDEAGLDATLARLSERQRIGQHLMLVMERQGRTVAPAYLARLQAFAIGGAVVPPITGLALHDPGASAAFVHDLQAASVEASGVPLFVACDQEGGLYATVNSQMGGTDSLTPLALGATADPEAVFRAFDLMGREMRALGYNLDFGPLLDTLHDQGNGNLNTRTFGDDPSAVARLGVAAVAGLQHQGVLATGKHFPGDGLTANNTHHEQIVNPVTRAAWEAQTLPPFRAAIDAGLASMMTIPMAYAAFDPVRSAVTSRAITTGLLRGELGFEGLVLTDDLSMAGVSLGLADGQWPAVEALRAGADLLLTPVPSPNDGTQDFDVFLEALVGRIEADLAAGTLDPVEFEASTRRILAWKQRLGLFDEPLRPTTAEQAALGEHLGRPDDAAAVRALAARSIVALGDPDGLPLPDGPVLCVSPPSVLVDPAAGWTWYRGSSLCDALAARRDDVTSVAVPLPLAASLATVRANLAKALPEAAVVVVSTFHAAFDPAQQQMLTELLDQAAPRPVVHVIEGVPRDEALSEGRVAVALVVMGALPTVLEAAVDVLLGQTEPEGVLPVTRSVP